MRLSPSRILSLAVFLFCSHCVNAQPAPQIVPLSSALTWQRLEFRISNLPAVSNPFDPDVIRVDATFTLPSGRIMVVPAFWYQAYQRALSAGSESLTISGSAEWRLRFTPPEAGVYSLALAVLTNGQPYGSPSSISFTAAAGSLPARTGFVGIAPPNQYFQTSDGQPLRLIGENVCWHGGRGTFDYDTWFPAMESAGENHARLWMWPSAFGIETQANSLTRYRLDRAWQLDYVLRSAEQHGIYILLCLDYHGMFEVTPDYWGGNNYWPTNPYNVTNGGPCLNQNGFFTNSTARAVYQKRLRYLVARYGYSPNLLAWEFFNEIDNVYSYLKPTDVAGWHAAMGDWLHAHDPFGHLVTTSLTGGNDRSELWMLPQLDFAAYHSYAETRPANRLCVVAQSFLSKYQKPVMIGEFGTDWRGWNRTNDPYLRGLRQGIWGGALGGSVGTAMSWWWENIQNENVYPVFSAVGTILDRTGWGRGTWTNITFKSSGVPPATVGSLLPGGTAFDAFLTLSGGWGDKPQGQLAIPNPLAASYSGTTLNGFVHGTAHPELRVPFRLSAWFTNNAQLVIHLNSVSGGATMLVRADGTELFRTNLPNLDGAWNVNNEYNIDIPINVPAGKHLLEISNAGVDWFFLDWVHLKRILPSTYVGNWLPSPAAIGLRGVRESLIYVVAPGLSFPGSATNTTLDLQQGQTVTMTNWPGGLFLAEWYNPATGIRVGTTETRTTNGNLALPLPDFREDLAGIVFPPAVLEYQGFSLDGTFQFQLDSESGGTYLIEKSPDLLSWSPFLSLTNVAGQAMLFDRSAKTNPASFFRARHAP